MKHQEIVKVLAVLCVCFLFLTGCDKDKEEDVSTPESSTVQEESDVTTIDDSLQEAMELLEQQVLSPETKEGLEEAGFQFQIMEVDLSPEEDALFATLALEKEGKKLELPLQAEVRSYGTENIEVGNLHSWVIEEQFLVVGRWTSFAVKLKSLESQPLDLKLQDISMEDTTFYPPGYKEDMGFFIPFKAMEKSQLLLCNAEEEQVDHYDLPEDFDWEKERHFDSSENVTKLRPFQSFSIGEKEYISLLSRAYSEGIEVEDHPAYSYYSYLLFDPEHPDEFEVVTEMDEYLGDQEMRYSLLTHGVSEEHPQQTQYIGLKTKDGVMVDTVSFVGKTLIGMIQNQRSRIGSDGGEYVVTGSVPALTITVDFQSKTGNVEFVFLESDITEQGWSETPYCISPDGKFQIFSADASSMGDAYWAYMVLKNTETGEIQYVSPYYHESRVAGYQFLSDNTLLVMGDLSTIAFYNPNTMELIKTVTLEIPEREKSIPINVAYNENASVFAYLSTVSSHEDAQTGWLSVEGEAYQVDLLESDGKHRFTVQVEGATLPKPRGIYEIMNDTYLRFEKSQLVVSSQPLFGETQPTSYFIIDVNTGKVIKEQHGTAGESPN